ncbi:MAG: flagellar M-ring protein FliF [Hyphomicrobiales bacterium]|nr:MAG: flagellar M-ring protein FliF [Hyphomicrobiales bacterium]
MGAVAAILVGFFAFLMIRFSSVQMVPLYAELDFKDTTAIVKELDGLAVPYEVVNRGGGVLVPTEELLRVRMALAEKGLPNGGSVGYEIFDKTDTLGTTSFVQSINHIRALEGELARTIRAIDQVAMARVHLVLPERQLFQRNKTAPSASIVLQVRGVLEQSQIRAIQHITASAVEGLKPQDVSIVDEGGRLLAAGGENAEEFMTGAIHERTASYEHTLRERIEDIVSEVVGPGRARVQVSAELDFNRITQTSETYDPEGQVVRSTQTKEETSATTNKREGVSAGNQIPDANANDGGDSTLDQSNSTAETVNYEISRTQRTEVIEAGRIKRISVAVLVDGVYSQTPEGELNYAERPEDEMTRISALVRSAMGYDEGRGDQIEVVNLRFANAPNSLALASGEESLFDFSKRDIFYFVELGVIVVLSLLTLLFAVRPLIKRILTPDEPEVPEIPEGMQMVVGPDGQPMALPSPEGGEGEGEHDWISVAQAEGELQAGSIERVGEMIKSYPTEAVTIVRNGLQEAPA